LSCDRSGAPVSNRRGVGESTVAWRVGRTGGLCGRPGDIPLDDRPRLVAG